MNWPLALLIFGMGLGIYLAYRLVDWIFPDGGK